MSPAAPRRFVVAVLACLGLFGTTMIDAGPAGASIVTWTNMTVAQKQSTLANAMFSLLNVERVANRKAPVLGSPTLVKSAMAHNLVMAKYDLMSHQCPGEASPGTRILRAGYRWQAWGENIGWTTDESVTGIQNMEKLMYGEKAPDNGHRLNILGSYKAVGISVYFDTAHHRIWYTQDFGTLA